MMITRQLTRQERVLLETLLMSKPENHCYIASLESLFVQEMNDGRMGSLLFFPEDSSVSNRAFAKQIAQAEFADSDGVPVSVSLNIDSNGMLYELDIWKADFSPLISLPEYPNIKIIE